MPIRLALLLLTASCAAQPVVTSNPPKSAAPTADKAGPAPKPAPPKNETLGQCLTRKGVHLYGASWCKPCHDQLAWFGEDAKNVPYTDCFPEDDTILAVPACEAVGLDMTSSFPTWILADGLRVIGSRSLKWLATSTDCPLRLK